MNTCVSTSNFDYGIIVLEYGRVGANAALQAAHLGARILLIEKASRGGGNSFVSSANMTIPTDFHLKSKSDGAQFAQYLEQVARGTTPPAVINGFVEDNYEVFE